MFIAAVIVSFVLGAVFVLLVQYWFVHRWLSYQPQLFPPYKQQHEKVQLPHVLLRSLAGIQRQHGSRSDLGARGATEDKKGARNVQEDRKSGKSVQDERKGSKTTLEDKKSGTTIPEEKRKEQSVILNVLFQFLFAELKDTARVRRWAARKMNVEFDEMLASTPGKLMNQIQVRDFNFGSSFPLVESIELKHVELSNDEDIIQTVDVALDIDYEGGFQLTLDVDIIFGAWAYLCISVTKLAGQGRLQLTRVPFTHWSFSFYEEPRMEFNVDSRFNGRPIPQISSLIVNQIKRTIRKKHVLPSYKMRYKPLFVKPEESFINPDICFRGHKLGAGKLSVKVLKCSRLQDLSTESKLFCTLSVDKEEIEEVWRQSWITLDMTLKIFPHCVSGLNLKDQLSGERTEKKRVVVDSIVPDSPAAVAGFQRGDIVETVGNVRVLSFKHAVKQLKNATDSVTFRIKRQSRLALDPSYVSYMDQAGELEVEEREINGDMQEDLADFVNIDYKPHRSTSLNSDNQTVQEPVKLSEKFSRKIQSGKKRILGVKDSDKDKENVTESKSLPADDEYLQSAEKNVADSTSVASFLHDKSQSAKSSPQKQVIDMSRQRAHSDTSLNKAMDGDTVSVSSDIGSYSYHVQQRRMGEVATREVTFKSEPEWNEEFEFDCKEEDQYVNLCVWCKMAQTDRSSKNVSTTNKTDSQQLKNTPPTDDLPSYDVTTKIGYVSIPLADITAGCLLTTQGDTQYTMYLQPPEETITASRSKLPFSGHIGFDKNICHGDITLSFVHKPFKTVEAPVRKEIVKDILNPPPVKIRAKSLERERSEGQHTFRPCQFTHRAYCDFCGKKIWLKGGLRCSVCRMVCHKKCVEKCYIQTKCSRDGPRIADKPDEPWVPPVKGQEVEKEEGKSSGKFWRFRQKEQPSLPLNIPQKNVPSRAQISSSPNRSPLRSPSPFASLSEHSEGHLTVGGMKKNLSSKSLPGTDKEDDSDEEFRYRNPTYSLDDNVVIEAKEKGKELYANLSLPERKKTLDDMVTKLQDTIDKESEYKSELIKNYQEMTDMDQKRLISQQLEKCDEKMEALMMMLVHYCAGLQHCLDQEEAHKRLMSLESDNIEDEAVTEDAGIQFVVTDT